MFVASPASAQFPRDAYVSVGIGWDYANRVTFESNGALLELDRSQHQPAVALGTKLGDG
jgi:hypothetical protein